MRVIVGCESSQVVCKAFRELGHEAYSCDILPCDGDNPEWHIQADILTVINGGFFRTQAGNTVYVERWDLGIFHPPCTFLTISAEWAYKDADFTRYSGVGYHQRVKPGTLTGEARRQAREESVLFCKTLLAAPIESIAMENPVGILSSRIRKPDQIIQPYQFGDDASKATCLWLKNLPLLKPTGYCQPRIVNRKQRWANQTDGGQNKLPPSEDRWKERSKTYEGIAKAMAEQWSMERVNQLTIFNQTEAA